MKMLLIALALIVSTSGAALSQTPSPVGRPCELTKSLRGTCFYDSNGSVSYWIVRWWRASALGGGPEYALDEIIGYPAVREIQQEYNRWMHSLKDVPQSFIIDDPESETNRQLRNTDIRTFERLQREQLDAIARNGLNGDTGHQGLNWNIQSPHPTVSVPPTFYGVTRHHWDHTGGADSIIAPIKIAETGELNSDTLRIPVFMAAERVFRVMQEIESDCRDASTTYNQWSLIHHFDSVDQEDLWTSDDIRGHGLCRLLPSKTAMFADWQDVLSRRLAFAEAARDAAKRYDDIVRELLPNDGAVSPDRVPAQRLSLLRAAIEESLRDEETLRPLTQQRAAACIGAGKRERSAYDKRIEKEARTRLDDEWMREYGEHFHFSDEKSDQ